MPATDPLSAALHALHPTGAVYHRGEARAPWGLSDTGGMASYHLVVEGRAWLTLPEAGQATWLEAGDFAVLPHGHTFTMADAPHTPTPDLDVVLSRHPVGADKVLRLPGMGARGAFICGGLTFGGAPFHPVLDALPPLLLVRGAATDEVPWLRSTLDFIACEAQSGRPGAETVMAHLSSVLFIHAVRAYLDLRPGPGSGWLHALHDPQIGRVLTVLQQAPEKAWSVDALASEAAMSRSAFAERFRTLVGEPPMRHVTRWRMHRAAHLLRTTPLTLADVAARVGYDSEAAFSRSFKRWTRQSPGSVRRMRA